ncbi:hypothetical protein R0K05_18525, partial [Planococcus sp. SIMBA_160]
LHLDVERRGIPLEIYDGYAKISPSWDFMVGGDNFAEAASIAQEALGEAFPEIDFTQMGDPEESAYFLPDRSAVERKRSRRSMNGVLDEAYAKTARELGFKDTSSRSALGLDSWA